MEVRKLRQEEHADTRPLYEEVFSEDSKSFVDYYYTEKTRDNQIYVVEEDGQICSMLHLNPYHVRVNGSEKEANYIVAVATRAEYRKRGYMGALLRHSLNDMYQAGEAFTFLMPAAEGIYLPYGFRTVYEQDIQYYQEADELLPGMEIKEAEETDLQELAEAANRDLGEHYQVYAERDAAYYRRLQKECASDGGVLLVYRKDGKIVDCRVRLAGKTSEGTSGKISEEAHEEHPKIMVRIVDVRRMLMALSLRSLAGMCFEVTDPVIEENNRCVLITGTEYSGVMLMEGKKENSEGTISVRALADLVFGASSVDEICARDDVRVTERLKEEWKKVIPLNRIYLNETV